MKRILPVVLCLALCLGLLAGCGNQTEAETDEGLLSAVAAVKDYLGGSLYQVEPMPDQETIEVNGERYYLMLVTAVAGEDSVVMEPTIAVKQSDSSLWAYYPDGTLEAIEADSVLYDVSDQPIRTDFTLEDVKEAADITKILETHGTFAYSMTGTDSRGEVVHENIVQYMRNDMGLCACSKFTMDGNTSYSERFIGEGFPGATYGLSPTEGYSMTIYPAGEYAASAAVWYPVGSENETFVECTAQDGAAIVTTRVDYRENADIYELHQYYLDPNTGELLAIVSETRDSGDDSIFSTFSCALVYDEPYEPAYAVAADVLVGAEKGAHLTVYMKEYAGAPEIQEFDLLPGTNVNFYAGADYQMYADPEHTVVLDTIGVIEEDTEIFVVFD